MIFKFKDKEEEVKIGENIVINIMCREPIIGMLYTVIAIHVLESHVEYFVEVVIKEERTEWFRYNGRNAICSKITKEAIRDLM